LMKYINNLFVEKEPNNEQEITKKWLQILELAYSKKSDSNLWKYVLYKLKEFDVYFQPKCTTK
jgi:hypothetical protein